jgi:prolyl 3-hydroxylase /prolyl 3,4-dihydroxylase
VISKLRQELYCSEFRHWLTAVTGIPTNDTIDMSCSIYSDTSYLLCHDDDLSERRIAYIMYFVDEEWSPEDGGTLDLFDHDADGLPTAIVKRLTPCWNSFGMFAVSSVSHHQVPPSSRWAVQTL